MSDHNADRETVFESDLGGRRVKLTDPNSGVSTYSYNASGQVWQIVSAAGTVTLAYDDLGRMTDRTSKTLGNQDSSSAHWEFDPAGHLGALEWESATTVVPGFVEDFTVKKVFDYNALHQVKSTELQLPESDFLGDLSNVDYVTEVEYDATGAAITSIHDAVGGLPEQTMTTGLDVLGRARSLTVADSADTRTVVSGVVFDALGRLVSREYGNGVTRAYGWDAVWGSLKTASASFEDSGTHWVQADAYARDGAGRVTAVRDAVAGVSQCYGYDGFNRLEAAWTDTRSSSTCVGGASAAVQPTSPFQDLGYAVGYAYEPTGEVDTIADLLSDVVSTYDYADTAHPNAVTEVEHVQDAEPEPVVTADTFAYDSAGRMTTRTVGATTTGMIWDVSSNLVATTGQGNDRVYLYDASGQRVAQLKVGDIATPVAQSATVYLGATEATDPNTASTSPDDVSATRFYAFGGATVATATAVTSGPVAWALLFGDVQGSAQVSMELVADTGEATGFEAADHPGHAVTRNAYQPYGSRRGADNLAVDRGWLGQYEDQGTGLTYLNARYYDPLIGRFLSPDPLMNPGDPRTLDPYRYADNNPISYMDATGLRPECTGLAKGSTGANQCNAAPSGKGGKTASTSDGRKPSGGGGGSKSKLPDDPCYQFGSSCWVGDYEAMIYKDAQAVLGNNVDPWANRTCYSGLDGFCDSGGMYSSGRPPSARELLAAGLVMVVIVGALVAVYICVPAAAACGAALTEFYATGGAGAGLTVYGAGVTAEVRLVGALPAATSTGVTSGSSSIVYRALAPGENAALGLTARSPGATTTTPLSHVAGKVDSPWISTTKSFEVASGKYGGNGVVAIDLTKVGTPVVDVSGGFTNGGRFSSYAIADQEVLIWGNVPADAIVGVWP